MYGTPSSAGDHDEAVVSAQTLGPTPLEMPEYFPLSLSSGEGPWGQAAGALSGGSTLPASPACKGHAAARPT